MNYALGHSLSARDLFYSFNTNKLKLTTEECKKIFSDGHKDRLAASIFMDSVKLVIDDIIDNNVHFKLPGIGRRESYLYMKRITGKQFKHEFKRGRWQDVDFINSDFSGNQIMFRIESKKSPIREKPIYLSKRDKQKITNNTNNGKQY